MYKIGYYTLARDSRELQPPETPFCQPYNYTLARDSRELQRQYIFKIFYYNYTLARDSRELQPQDKNNLFLRYYTLARNSRELQPMKINLDTGTDYTLARDSRELQQSPAREFNIFAVSGMTRISSIRSPVSITTSAPSAFERSRSFARSAFLLYLSER